MNYDPSEILQKLLEAMREQGLAPSPGQDLISDGNLHRYHVDGDKPRTKNGAYQIFLDDHPAAWFKSWRDPNGTTYTVSLRSSTLTPRQREKMQESLEEKKRDRRASQAELAAQAAEEALRIWNQATEPQNDEEYLSRKKVHPYRLRQHGDALLVPLTDMSGKLQNLQQIFPNGGKRFLKGGAVKGHYCCLPGGNDKTPILLCEGWATGATLFEAVGWTTVCAMNAGNLLPVGTILRKRYPDRDIILCADDDWPGKKILEAMAAKRLSPEDLAERGISENSLALWTRSRVTPPPSAREKLAALLDLQKGQIGNPGIEKAQACLLPLGGVMAEPPFGASDPGSDWNDYAALYGLASVKKHLEKILEEHQAAKGAEKEATTGIPSPWEIFPGMYITSKGKPLGIIENLRSLFAFYKIRCRYNQVTKDIELLFSGEGAPGDISESAAYARAVSLAAKVGYPTQNLGDYLYALAEEEEYNPVREWISSSPWDGVERLSLFHETITVSPEFSEDLKKTLITKWLTGAVAAAYMDKGFCSRGVLVLQGPQGIGKTSWFRNLAPHESGWVGDGRLLDPADKDSVHSAVSFWIVELGELEATFKRADLARLKAFITNQADKIRLPYGRKHSVFARRTVFAASVNDTRFLLDDTGNSRWWVIPCREISYNHGIDMQQLWAEIYHRYYKPFEKDERKRYLWWLSPEEERELEIHNKEHESADPVEELLFSKLDWEAPRSMWGDKTASEALQECSLPPTKSNATKAGKVLTQLCGPSKKQGGGRRVFFMPPKKRTPLVW